MGQTLGRLRIGQLILTVGSSRGQTAGKLGGGVVWLTRWAGGAGDPFGFAQGRLFSTPEERLRSG